jgi:hypothetical protein
MSELGGVTMHANENGEMKPSLIMIQFLSWVADRPRSYTETMEAWQTTCAKFSPWEDAVIEGLVHVKDRAVKLTERGSGALTT